MPQWLTLMLLAAGALITAAFLAEPVIAATRKRRQRRSATEAARLPATLPASPAATAPDTGSGPDNGLDDRPEPDRLWPWQGPPGIVVADYERLVVTHSRADNTVCVLRPPGADPEAILKVARLVLAEDPYQALAGHLGLPADHDRLVVTSTGSTVCVLRPPGERPQVVLSAARLILPEDCYEELAGQLGVPASWPIG